MANIVDTLLDLVREIEAGDWIDKRDVTKALGKAAEEIERLTAELVKARKYMRHLPDCCINFENSLEALEGLCDCGLAVILTREGKR